MLSFPHCPAQVQAISLLHCGREGPREAERVVQDLILKSGSPSSTRIAPKTVKDNRPFSRQLITLAIVPSWGLTKTGKVGRLSRGHYKEIVEERPLEGIRRVKRSKPTRRQERRRNDARQTLQWGVRRRYKRAEIMWNRGKVDFKDHTPSSILAAPGWRPRFCQPAADRVLASQPPTTSHHSILLLALD